MDDLTPHWYKRSIASTRYGTITNPCAETLMEVEGKNMSKLYEIIQGDQTLYGTKLAVNSAGKWVMEIKGTGEVISVDKVLVEEVMPYTIGVQFDTSKMTYHYLANKGKHEAGEFYILDAPLGRAIVKVVAVDTKSQSATKQFEPLAKLVTE